MEERPHSLKRKREPDYPRVTFTSGTRTFDRLLKETSLEELTEGVRRKLGYASDVPLQLAQLRDGKTVDLEDGDDYEAFCATAHAVPVITVQVTAPEGAPRFTPAKSTPAPPTRPPTAEPSSRKKQKKKKTDPVDEPDKSRDANEKPGQKRKAHTEEPEVAKTPDAEEDDVPPKKKKKKDTAKEPTNAQIAQRLEGSHPTAKEKVVPVAEKAEPSKAAVEASKDAEGLTKKEKKKKKKEKQGMPVTGETGSEAPIRAESEAHQVPSQKPRKEERRRLAAKAKAEAEAEAKEKAEAAQREREKADAAQKEKDKAEADRKEREKAEATQKEKEKAEAEAARKEKERAQKEKSKADTTQKEKAKKTQKEEKSKAKGKASKPTEKPPHINGQQDDEESDADDLETILDKYGKDQDDSSESSESKGKTPVSEGSEETEVVDEPPKPKSAVPIAAPKAPAKAPAVNGKEKDISASEKNKEPSAGVVASTSAVVKKGKKEKAAAKAPLTVAQQAEIQAAMSNMLAAKKSVQPDIPASDPAAKKLAKEAETASGDCALCGAPASHKTCKMASYATSTLRKKLRDLKSEQTSSPTDFRARQIAGVAALIKEKETQDKVAVVAKSKVVSDEGVTDVTVAQASSVKTAKLVDQAQVSAATARIVQQPPGESLSAAGPSSKKKQTISTAAHSQQSQVVPSKPAPKPIDTPSESSSDDEPLDISTAKPLPALSHPPTLTITKPSNDKVSAATVRPAPQTNGNAVASTSKNLAPATALSDAINRSLGWSDEEAFPSISQAPLSQKTQGKKPAAKAPSDDEDSDEEPTTAQPTSTLPDLSILPSSSYANINLDDLIRGPRVSMSTKYLLSSGSEDEDEDADIDPEGLVQDEDDGPVSRRISKMFKAAGSPSSEEEQSDGPEQDSDAENDDDDAPVRPPRLSISTIQKSRVNQTDDDADAPSSSAVQHGDLSFGDVNGLASPVEIDTRGDRAFSEALADDNAVFSLAAADVDDTSRESSKPVTPEKDDESEAEEENAEQGKPDREEEMANDDQPIEDNRHDSIEPFESPAKQKAQSPPRSPIDENDAEIVQHSTPRRITRRMKGKDGKAPESPAPHISSLDKALKLWDSVAKSKGEEKSKDDSAKARTTRAKSAAPVEPTKVTTRSKSAAPPSPPKSRLAKALLSQPLKTIKSTLQGAAKPTLTRQTRSQKPVSTQAPAVTPRTTRAAAKRAASVQPEEAAASLPTQESAHKWEVLPAAESSSQPDETMNMDDELQSVPEAESEAEGENLFIPSETQNSFPYSQWQVDKKRMDEESDDDEEDEVGQALVEEEPTPPQVKRKAPSAGFPRLSQIASQSRTFRTSLPGPSQQRRPAADKKRRETMAELYGHGDQDPSDGSGSDSDSDSDAEKPVERSHIPKSRRAGAGIRSRV
ncbi:hypothetical protein DFP72DRAFT_1166387 [Ephemerocybe angulata]|uniref:Uncharacterized protein n=1 Tax=Ephemerocybe angulata TaxID=980116 RepID=A0A8H6I726_9AGAR|nr:hypothetical protein DFP72DRAFT_1166387 [Tulosesus angulatus]